MADIEALKSDDTSAVRPYRRLARLGSGSFGTVYAARRRDRPEELAAVKVARPEFSESADFPARFRAEIDAIEMVQSSFVPKIIDSRPEDEPAWIATELIPGLPLDKVIGRSGPLPEEAVWHLGIGIATALEAIHGCGLVHRDLRPKNVLLTPNGPWVIDFNLAHLVDIAHRDSSLKPRGDYGYMPPEEALNGLKAAKEPADVFALGATLVFAATTHAPFEGASPADVISARPNLDGLPDGLRGLVEACLLSAPEDRLPLRELLREFALRTDGAGQDGFAAVLPRDVLGRLEDYRNQLADVIGGRGPAQLGWGDASPAVSGAPLGRGVSPPSADLRHPVAAPSPVRSATAVPIRWTSEFDSWISGPVAVHEDRLAVALLNGTVAVLQTDDGKPPVASWREPVDVEAALHAEPLLVAQNDGGACAYVGAADGRVHAIDLASGLARVVAEAGAAIEGAPVPMGERICVLSADGRVHSVDPRTGERKLLFDTSAAATGALSAVFSTIFVTDAGGRVHAIDANAGGRKWQSPTGGLVLSAPLPVAVWLYVCGTDGIVQEIAITDGHPRAMAEVGAPLHVAPVRDRNRLYVGSSNGVLHAYDIGRRGPERL